MPSSAAASGTCDVTGSTCGSSSTEGRGSACTSEWRVASTPRVEGACASGRAVAARSLDGHPGSRSSGWRSRAARSWRSPTAGGSVAFDSGGTPPRSPRSPPSASTPSANSPHPSDSARSPGVAERRSRRSCWTSRSRRASETGSPTRCSTRHRSRPGARPDRSPTPSSTGSGPGSVRSSVPRCASAPTATASRDHGCSTGDGTRRTGTTVRGEAIRWDTIAGRTTAWVPTVQR